LIVEALSAVYGAAATWRRQWYARRPRRLQQPVISIGNLRVGGTGKTPAVACIAQLLAHRGERPAVLSRGYARQKPSSDVTIVSTPDAVVSDVAHAGDEPMLLARALPGVPVLVCADRARAGRLAEARFDVTVHLLDDGFQHVQLARDVDLLLVDAGDLEDRVLPAGRLREPLANAHVADAVLVSGTSHAGAGSVARRLGVRDAFAVVRALGAPRALGGSATLGGSASSVFALAAIARPERFVDDLRAAGFSVAGTRTFRDHHVFTRADIDAVVRDARRAGAAAVVTTEKDAVRLEGLDLSGMPFLSVPLAMSIEPADAFAAWLSGRLAHIRAARRP
jgi:tetraacyldisaccharide 4'-kinase